MLTQTEEQSERRIATAPGHYRAMVDGPARFAVVRGARTVREVEAYLPANYSLMESWLEDPGHKSRRAPALVAIIGGTDSAGWTLDGYVTPRLLSGLMSCHEIS